MTNDLLSNARLVSPAASRVRTMTDWVVDELRRLQQSREHNSRMTALSSSRFAAGLPQSFDLSYETISDAHRSHPHQGQLPDFWSMHPLNRTQTPPSTQLLSLHSGLQAPFNRIASSQPYNQSEWRNVQQYFQALSVGVSNSMAITYPIQTQGTVNPPSMHQQQGVQQLIQGQSMPWPSSSPPVVTLSTVRTLSDLGSQTSGQVQRQALPTSSLARSENSHPTNSTSTNSGQSTSSTRHSSLFPAIVSCHQDSVCLSLHQAFLREQLEFFQANEDDVAIRTRGRTRPIRLGQVGLRCRHCAHVSPAQRQKGSVYFPISIYGLYQAGQNLSTAHIQCGACMFMADGIKAKFADLIPSKKNVSSGGRRYWATCAKQLGLVDTEHGICSSDCIPPGVVVLDSLTVRTKK